MAEREPVRIVSAAADLSALAQDLTRFAVIRLPTIQRFIASVWLEDTAGNTQVITAESRDIIDRLEVFPLVVGPVQAIPDDLDWAQWPFDAWRIDVLRRMDWLIKTVAGPDDPPPVIGPDGAPPNAYRQHVDVGLLVTGSTGRRILIASDDFPLTLVVSQADSEIDAFLSNCLSIPLPDYIRQLADGGSTPSRTP
jgi:hypothetical protein